MSATTTQPPPSPRITRIGYIYRDSLKDLEDAVNGFLEQFPRCQPLGPVSMMCFEGESKHFAYVQTMVYYGKVPS